MKNDIYDYLMFKLGSESAEYEFDIIPIPPYEFLENNLSLEPYEYFGETSEILGCKVKQIILYYNADILMRIEIKFKGDVVRKIKSNLENQDINFPEEKIFLKISLSQNPQMTNLICQKSILNTHSS